MLRVLPLLLSLLLSGCLTEGSWIPTIWGGQGLESGGFEDDDGCTLAIDAFVISIPMGALLTPEGTASAVLHGDQLFDLVPPGPQSMASVDVRKGPYPETVYFLGPAVEPGPNEYVGSGKVVGIDNAESDLNPVLGNATARQRDAMIEAAATALVEGSVTCAVGDQLGVRSFSWLLTDDDGLLRCPNPSLEVVGGSFGASMVTVAGEQLFPEPVDGQLRSLWAVGADGTIPLGDAEATLGGPLAERLRQLYAAEGACTWEALEES